jgi:L-fuconolactonase
MIVDAHHHLWNPARGDYGWMPAGDPILSRPYRLMEAETTFREHGVGQSVIVQAAPTIAETEYLLGVADSSDIVAGVVGWIDFEDRQDRSQLERLSKHPKFRSVRPMVQDIADDDWLLRPGISWAFNALRDLDLAFDALGFPRHASRFLETFQRYPELRAVIDHCLKPAIRNGEFDRWARDMERLANETPALVKLSGLVTEAGADCSVAALKPYVDHVLASFGPRRVMWGSDWPVCRLKAEYGDWLASARAMTSHLSEDEQTALFAANAQGFYRLTPERIPELAGEKADRETTDGPGV